MNRPILIVIAGPNGSGKTSTTRQLIRHEWAETCEYINPDDIAQQLFGDWNNQDAVLKAAQYAEQRRNTLLQEHKNLIFETVLSSQSKVDYIHRAKEEGYFIRLFFISTSSPAINASRVAKRVMEGGHDVPITKIISRYMGSINNARILSHIVDRAYFYDNSVEDHEAKLLFRTANGAVEKIYTDVIPEWAMVILQDIEKE